MVDIYFKQTINRPVFSKLIKLFYVFFTQILQRTVTGLQLVFIHQIKKKKHFIKPVPHTNKETIVLHSVAVMAGARYTSHRCGTAPSLAGRDDLKRQQLEKQLKVEEKIEGKKEPSLNFSAE